MSGMKVCLLAPGNSVHTLKIAYSLREEGHEVWYYHSMSLKLKIGLLNT